MRLRESQATTTPRTRTFVKTTPSRTRLGEETMFRRMFAIVLSNLIARGRARHICCHRATVKLRRSSRDAKTAIWY